MFLNWENEKEKKARKTERKSEKEEKKKWIKESKNREKKNQCKNAGLLMSNTFVRIEIVDIKRAAPPTSCNFQKEIFGSETVM